MERNTEDAEPHPDWLKEFQLDKAELNVEQRQEVERLLFSFIDVISTSKEDLGRCVNEKCEINTGDARPVRMRWRRLSQIKQAAVDAEIKSLMKRGLIRDSVSSWCSPLVVVPKKLDEWRVCADYRGLNLKTERDSYPMPDVKQVLEDLGGNEFFSTLDLTSGYFQVEMEEKDKEKTAFITRDGLYEYNVMPFGLVNAPSQFSRIMEKIFRGSKEHAVTFMDDIIVKGSAFERAVASLRHVFEKLRIAGLKIRPSISQLLRRVVKFLGHKISKEGIAPDDAKVEAITSWPTPQNVDEVVSFLGLCGYYRKFVKGFASTAAPLNALRKKEVSWEWTDECQDAFDSLKKSLVSPPILGYPRFTKEAGMFYIDVDASDTAAGGILSQMQDGQEKVLEYGHLTFNNAQKKYCATMKELMSLVTFVIKFKEMLWGCPATVRTDHRALIWLRKVQDTDKMLARWFFTIAEVLNLDFNAHALLESVQWKIIHRPGKEHAKADGM